MWTSWSKSHGKFLPVAEVLLKVLPDWKILLKVLIGPKVLLWGGRACKGKRSYPLLWSTSQLKKICIDFRFYWLNSWTFLQIWRLTGGLGDIRTKLQAFGKLRRKHEESQGVKRSHNESGDNMMINRPGVARAVLQIPHLVTIWKGII